jgi:hypothetical protein
MKLARTIAFAGAFLAAQTSFANGYTGNAWNGSGCTYPTSVVFTNNVMPVLGGGFDYDITTNGVTQTLHYYNEGAFFFGLNCSLGYTRNQTVYFEMKGTNIFSSLNHAGLLAKSYIPNASQFLAEGPIFWGPNAVTAPMPAIQIEKYAFNWSGKTQTTGPSNTNSTDTDPSGDYPNGAPVLADGVTYRVWVDANYDGTQVWVLDPNGNTVVRSTWVANIVQHWSSAESVDPYQFGIGFFAIPNSAFPFGAKIEFTNISVNN